MLAHGVSILSQLKRDSPDIQLISDASGSWGCGAFSGTQCFQLQWSDNTEQHHITIKELIPIVIAVAIWGKSWPGKTVQAQCDESHPSSWIS